MEMYIQKRRKRLLRGMYQTFLACLAVLMLLSAGGYAGPAGDQFANVVTAEAKKGKNKLQPSGKDANGSVKSSVNDLNDILATVLQTGGAIVVALGIIVIIQAFSEQNMQSKTRGSLLIGGGIFLLALDKVIDAFSTAAKTGSDSLAKSVLVNIGKLMQYAGIVIAALGVIQVIMSFMNTNPEEKASGMKSLAMGLAFLAGNSIMSGCALLVNNKASKDIGSQAVGFVVKYVIARPVSYIGVGLMAFGVIQIIMGFKDEDANSKHQGTMMLVTGLALVTILGALNGILGIKGGSYNKIVKNSSSGAPAPKGGWDQSSKIFKK